MGRENEKDSRVVNKCRNVKNESCRQIVKKMVSQRSNVLKKGDKK